MHFCKTSQNQLTYKYVRYNITKLEELVKKAFTLAEVLITLGIIGVVAAMTMSVLIANHQKQETVVMLKKAYSEISQALARAEVDHGTIDTWSFEPTNRVIFTQEYLKPYIKVLRFCNDIDGSPKMAECWTEKLTKPDGNIQSFTFDLNDWSFITPSGYSVLYWLHGSGQGGHFFVDVNGPKKGPNRYGRDIFRFILTFAEADNTYNDTVGYQTGLRGYGLNDTNTRDDLLTNCSQIGNYCSGLIILDGWQIKKDYPW